MIDFFIYGDDIDDLMQKYEINTPLRIAHFLAQIDHESSGLMRMTESLNYSVEALMATFSRSRISEQQCRMFGRTPTQKANQKAIANTIYGGEWGKLNLGNVYPNDGWKYRGRGALMCTGRANYRAYMNCLLYTSPSPRDGLLSRMPSSA